MEEWIIHEMTSNNADIQQFSDSNNGLVRLWCNSTVEGIDSSVSYPLSVVPDHFHVHENNARCFSPQYADQQRYDKTACHEQALHGLWFPHWMLRGCNISYYDNTWLWGVSTSSLCKLVYQRVPHAPSVLLSRFSKLSQISLFHLPSVIPMCIHVIYKTKKK